MHRRAYFRRFSFRRDRVRTVVFAVAGTLALAQEGRAQGFGPVIGQSAETINAIIDSQPAQIFREYAKTATGPVAENPAFSSPGIAKSLTALGVTADVASIGLAYTTGGTLASLQKVSEVAAVRSTAAIAGLVTAPLGPNISVGAQIATGVAVKGSLDAFSNNVAPKIGDALAPYTADGRYASEVEKRLAAASPPDPFGLNAEERRQANEAIAAKAAAEKSASLQAITQQTQKAEGQYQVYLYQNCLTDAYSLKSTCATTFPRGAVLAKQQANPQPAQAAAANQSVANLAPVAAPLPSASPSSVKSGQFLTSAQALDAIGKGADPKNLRQLTAYESIVAIGNGLDPNGLWVLQPAGSHPAIGSVPPLVPPATGLATTVAPAILAIPGSYPVGAAPGVRSLGGGLAASDAFFRAVMNDPKRSLNERKFAAGMLQLNMPANSYSREIAGYLLGLPQPVPGVIKPIGLSSSPTAARNPSLANLGVTKKQVNTARAAPQANSAMPTRTSVAEATGRPAGVKTPEQLAAIHRAQVRAARAAAQAQYEAALQNQQNAEMARAFILGVMSGLASGAASAPSGIGRSSAGAAGRGGPLRGMVVSPGGWHGNTGCVSYIGHTMYVRPC